MTTAELIVIDLSVAAATSAFWATAGVALASRTQPSRLRARFALACIVVAAAGLIAQIELAMALGENGWWFAQEKLVFSLPVTALATMLAVAVVTPSVLAAATARSTTTQSTTAHPTPLVTPIVPTLLMVASCASTAGIAARLVVGFPMTPLPATVLIALIALAGWLAYAIVARTGWMPVASTGALLALVVVSSLGFAWHQSLESAASPTTAAAGIPAGTSVTDLREPVSPGDDVHRVTLRAQKDSSPVAAGTVHTWSFGALPGPEIRVTQGEVVQATLINKDVPAGVTLHWHGYPVPGGDDGVAGVTQDALQAGESFEYRFAATDTGTYWYHSHTDSAEAVERGLFGTLVVLPPGGIPQKTDITLAQHTLGDTVFLGDSDRVQRRAVPVGETVRVRLVNTDPDPTRFRLAGAPFVVAAVDGRDIAGASVVQGSAVRLPAGGRADVTFIVPPTGVRVTSDATTRADLSVAPGSAVPPPTDPSDPDLDLLHYGTPSVASVPHGTALIDAEMVLDRLPRFFQGTPQTLTTVGGAVIPHVPELEVREGNAVRLTVVNRGFTTHPLHVHGHEVRVISRNGRLATGAPLWLDSIDIQPGEVWEVGFAADNPGIWTDRSTHRPPTGDLRNDAATNTSVPADASELLTISYRGVVSPFGRQAADG